MPKVDLLPVFKKDWDYILNLNNQFFENYATQTKPTSLLRILT